MCTVPKRSFVSCSTSLRLYATIAELCTADRERRHFLSTQHAQRPHRGARRRANERTTNWGTCRFSCFHCHFYCKSVSLIVFGAVSFRRFQCVWVVGPQYKFIRVYTGKLPLGFADCALYVSPSGISFYIPNYCSLISKTHQSAYWMSYYTYLHSIFIGASPKSISMWNKLKKSYL